MKLTEKIVETALYEGRSHMSKSGRKRWSRHVLWDDSLPGLGLRITSTNRKSFIVSYRAGGRKRTKTLGTTDKLSLSEARRQAAELLDSADESPRRAAAAEEAAGVETVAQLADTYLDKHLKAKVPSWFADQRLIRTHIKPALGRSKVAEVTLTDLANLRGRVGRRFPDDARRLKPLLEGMFDWAAAHGLWSGSPREAARARGRRKAEPDPDTETGTAPETEVEAAAEPEPEPAAPRTAAELERALEHSETQRRELAAQLEEISTSGVEMLRKLNEQATEHRELESKLAESRRALDRLKAINEELPDPEKTEKRMANLRQSVEQLMESVNRAESERDQLAEKLAATEKRARQQSQKAVALARARNDLESKALERDREEALRRVQRKAGGRGRREAVLLAAGVVAGALATLLLLRALPGEGTSRPSTPSVADAGETRTAPAALEPPSAAESEAGGPPASRQDDGVAAASPSAEPSPATVPDPAAADAAVAAWAAAWSEQRVDDYLEAYSAEFVPPDGLRRGEWASQRRNRIQRPRSIRVSLGPMSRTELDDGRVRLTFEQSYETETYSDQVVKTLELLWEDDAWKIASERTG